jgi:sugar-specific transcriptional regulator TrmB
MDVSILEELGLTGAEVKVYLALLELGTISAGRIIEKSNLQNSVVHRALNSLIEKGLISFILQGKKKIYKATNPENFRDFIENKKKRFEELLPGLKEKQKIQNNIGFGEIFKGKKGINQMYTTLLNSGGKEYNTFGGGSKVTYEVMGEKWWINLHDKRIGKKMRCRQIFDETIREYGSKLNKKPHTEIKFLPEEYSQLQETIIIGDYVGISIFTENPYGILIMDKAVAEGYRKQFELLWKLAKK